MASEGTFTDRLNLPVPGDGQDEPADDETQARSITDPSGENWGDILQTLIMSDMDSRMLDHGSLSGRPQPGESAPRWYVVESGGESADQPYLTYNDDTEWRVVGAMPIERTVIDVNESPYNVQMGESVWVDASGGAVEVNLPEPDDGGVIRVVVTDATNTVTITRTDTTDSDGNAHTPLIDGEDTDITRDDEGTTELESNDLDWWRTTVEPERSGTTDITTFAAFVFEDADAGGWRAVDAAGDDIDSGSNGMAVLQSAVDAIADGGRVFARGDMVHDADADTVTIGGGKWLVGHDFTIDHQQATGFSGRPFDTQGSVTTTSSDLAANASKGDNHVTVNDASLFAIGDVVRLQSTATYASGTTDQEGEYHRIWDIDTTNDILYFVDPVSFDHATGDSPTVTLVDTEEVHFRGIEINGPGAESSSWGIFVRHAADSTIEEVTLTDIGEKVIDFQSTYNCTLRDSHIERSNVAGDGYGIRMRNGAANSRIINNTFYACRHAVAHSTSGDDGLPRGTVVRGNTATGTTKGGLIDAHTGTIDMVVENNYLYPNDSAAIITGCRETTIRGNTVRGVHDDRENEGGFVRTASGSRWADRSLLIVANAVYGGANHSIIRVSANNDTFETIAIHKNYFWEPQEQLARIRQDTDQLSITDNVIDCGSMGGAGSNWIEIGDTSNTPTFRTVIVSGNEFYETSDQPLFIGSSSWISALEFVVVRDNTVVHSPHDGGDHIFRIYSGDAGVAMGNVYYEGSKSVGNVFDVGSDVTDLLIKDNVAQHSGTFLGDSGTDTVVDDNWEETGTGWSAAS